MSQRSESDRASLLEIMILPVMVVLPQSYLVLGVVRAVAGSHGVPLSPLIASLLLVVVRVPVVLRERVLKGRDPGWTRRNDAWVRFLQAVWIAEFGFPLLAGFVHPLVVWRSLSVSVSLLVCFVPVVALVSVVAVNRHRVVRSSCR